MNNILKSTIINAMILSLSAITFSSLAQTQIRLHGNIDNSEIITVFLLNGSKIDSASVENRSFKMVVNNIEPSIATFMFRSTNGLFSEKYPIFLDKGNIQIDIIGNILDIKEDEHAMDFQQLWKKLLSINNTTDELKRREAAAIANKNADTTSVKKDIQNNRKLGFELVAEFVKSHPNSPVSIAALRMVGRAEARLDISQSERYRILSELFYSLNESNKLSSAGLKYADFLKQFKSEI